MDRQGMEPATGLPVDCHVVLEGWLHFDKNRGDLQPRRARCTTTLLVSPDQCILIDPGWDPDDLLHGLAERGMSPSDVDTVFLTHFHPDHYEAVALFPDALWCMAGKELSYWRSLGTSAPQFARVFPARSLLAPWVHVVPTPGHTPGHCSILAATRRGFTAIAGDAVMTSAYFWRREPFHNAVDWHAAADSISVLADLADEIVPGHGAAFSTTVDPTEAPQVYGCGDHR